MALPSGFSSLLLKVNKNEAATKADTPATPAVDTPVPGEAAKAAETPSLPVPATKQSPLAKLNTTEQDSNTRAQADMAMISAAHGDMDFKSRLDALDALIQSDLGLCMMTIDAARAHVKSIMIDLKESPELDAILIDRDVHNVLRFIRHVKDDAVAVVEKKVEKKAVKAKKGGFNLAALDLTALPADLKALSNLKS